MMWDQVAFDQKKEKDQKETIIGSEGLGADGTEAKDKGAND